MKLSTLLVIASLGCSTANAAELSYAVTNLLGRPGIEGARGLELRASFGGEYGDKWSVWAGGVRTREISTGHLCHTSVNGARCLQIEQFPAYSYAAINRRFYLRPHDNLKLYAGTGIGYRDMTTCIQPTNEWGGRQRIKIDGQEYLCVPGDLSVSSRWAFSQELGLVWRHVLDFSLGHFSTGGISEWNRGDNFARFGFVTNLKRRKDGR